MKDFEIKIDKSEIKIVCLIIKYQEVEILIIALNVVLIIIIIVVR
jgi:hypothetical protein